MREVIQTENKATGLRFQAILITDKLSEALNLSECLIIQPPNRKPAVNDLEFLNEWLKDIACNVAKRVNRSMIVGLNSLKTGKHENWTCFPDGRKTLEVQSPRDPTDGWFNSEFSALELNGKTVCFRIPHEGRTLDSIGTFRAFQGDGGKVRVIIENFGINGQPANPRHQLFLPSRFGPRIVKNSPGSKCAFSLYAIDGK